jgi:hypothetical protein
LRLSSPVILVVLDDAERIYPEEPDSKLSSDHNGVLKGFGEEVELYVVT